MIQAFGLTSTSRKAQQPAVDDVSFEAPAGQVTALLGGAGAGKTTALRLMLELQHGRGITYFRGRPLHRIAHPSREVGVLLGDVPGHPARSVRGHLRMLCAASGVPTRRADEVLEAVGLVSFRDERLGTLSCGMDRRLGLACALLPDPHTLVLDEPAEGLSAREAHWLHGMLRAHADQGGTVLMTTADSKEAARTADRIVTLDGGRLVADQAVREFARNRLRPRVAVRSPHAARLAALLAKEARISRRSVEVVREGGNRLSVYGSTTADVGETAFRHGILIHQLANEVGDMGPGAGTGPDGGTAVEDAAPERGPAVAGTSPSDAQRTVPDAGRTEQKTPVPAAPSQKPEQAAADRPPVERGRTVFGLSAPVPAAAVFGASMAERRQAGADGTPGQREDAAPARPVADTSPVVLRLSASSRQGPGSPAARQTPSRNGWSVAERSTEAVPDPASMEQDVGEASASASAEHAAAGHGGAGPGLSSQRPDLAASELPPAAHGAAAGIVSDGREEATAGPSSQGLERVVSSLASAEEARASSVPSAWERAQAFAGGRSSLGQALGCHSLPDHKGTSQASARSDEDTEAGGEARGQDRVGPGGEDAPPRASAAASVEALARAEGSFTAGTVPDAGRHENSSGAESQPGSVRTPVVGIPASRSRLPGARYAGTRQPQALGDARTDSVRPRDTLSPLPPPISVRPAPSPLRPLRYEIRRAAGIGTGFLTCGAVLVVSALTAVLLAGLGHTPQARLFAAWPRELPLPPAALAAGLLGALAYGDEFRHPALAADRGTVPRRLGLLAAKLLVSGATASLLAFLTVGCDAEALYIVYGREVTHVPGDWLSQTASWFGLVVGCGWSGVLAAGVFRSASAGLAAVLAAPGLVAPLLREALRAPAVPMAADFPVRLREVSLLQWPFGGGRCLVAAARIIAQPVGAAMALSLTALLCAYLFTALRTRA